MTGNYASRLFEKVGFYLPTELYSYERQGQEEKALGKKDNRRKGFPFSERQFTLDSQVIEEVIHNAKPSKNT